MNSVASSNTGVLPVARFGSIHAVDSSSFMSARNLFKVNDGDFPANGSPRQKLEFAAKIATLAPAASDLPRWSFRAKDTFLELVAKADDGAGEFYADEHESVVDCGAGLTYLNLALRHFGCFGRVALFPDLDEPELVARVHMGSCVERDARERQLFAAIGENRSNGETPVSETMLAALRQAVAGERGWLDFAESEMSRQRLVEIGTGDRAVWPNFDRRPSHPPVSPEEWLEWRWPRRLFVSDGRHLESRNLAHQPLRQPSMGAATLAVVKTKTDDKHGWLAAGQIMARVALQAKALGLAWAIVSPMRSRPARETLRLEVGRKGFAQVILRFGPITTGEPNPRGVSEAVGTSTTKSTPTHGGHAPGELTAQVSGPGSRAGQGPDA